MGVPRTTQDRYNLPSAGRCRIDGDPEAECKVARCPAYGSWTFA